MPVDRPDRHAELGGKRGLVHVGVALDLFEQGQLTSGVGGFHVQNSVTEL